MDLEAVKIRAAKLTSDPWSPHDIEIAKDHTELITEVERLREALGDAIATIRRGRLSSIGSLENTYVPQIDVDSVIRWAEALKGG